jgi:hypothetical protein
MEDGTRARLADRSICKNDSGKASNATVSFSNGSDDR